MYINKLKELQELKQCDGKVVDQESFQKMISIVEFLLVDALTKSIRR